MGVRSHLPHCWAVGQSFFNRQYSSPCGCDATCWEKRGSNASMYISHCASDRQKVVLAFFAMLVADASCSGLLAGTFDLGEQQGDSRREASSRNEQQGRAWEP